VGGNAAEFTFWSPDVRPATVSCAFLAVARRSACGWGVRVLSARQWGKCKTPGEQPPDTEETDVTIRSDAALNRRVTGARLVTTIAVLGGALGLAGLGVLGDLAPAPAHGGSPALVTVELSQAVAHR
jgi:hypothetical protein